MVRFALAVDSWTPNGAPGQRRPTVGQHRPAQHRPDCPVKAWPTPACETSIARSLLAGHSLCCTAL